MRHPKSQKTVSTYALLDSGSTTTFCAEKLLEQLGVRGEKERISLTTLEKKDSRWVAEVTSLTVADVNGTRETKLPWQRAPNEDATVLHFVNTN